MTHNFKSGDKHYEVFFSDDDSIEVYERDDAKEGLIFDNKKQLVSFINNLTDIAEDEVTT